LTEKLTEINMMREANEEEIKNLNAAAEQQRAELQLQNDELDIANKDLDATNKAQASTILAQEETITAKEDVENQLDMVREHNELMDGQKDELNKELENASDYILRLEDKFFEAKKTSLDLLKQLKEAELEGDAMAEEVEMLKAYIIDLKSRIAVYIPVKGDTIDKKLAEYINNYPDRQKLKIMFMRESEGVY